MRGRDIVLTMLSDADAVLEVAGRALPAAREGVLWLQTSTVGIDGTDRCAGLAREHGAVLVGAPVLGTKAPAEQGALVVLASGPDHALDRLAPVFDAIGQRTLRVGPAGAGTRLKLVANAWVVTVVQGAAETLALAQGLGLDPTLLFEAVEGGPLDLPYLRAKGAAMLKGDFSPSFSLRLAAKDARLVAETAEHVGVEARSRGPSPSASPRPSRSTATRTWRRRSASAPPRAPRGPAPIGSGAQGPAARAAHRRSAWRRRGPAPYLRRKATGPIRRRSWRQPASARRWTAARQRACVLKPTPRTHPAGTGRCGSGTAARRSRPRPGRGRRASPGTPDRGSGRPVARDAVPAGRSRTANRSAAAVPPSATTISAPRGGEPKGGNAAANSTPIVARLPATAAHVTVPSALVSPRRSPVS